MKKNRGKKFKKNKNIFSKKVREKFWLENFSRRQFFKISAILGGSIFCCGMGRNPDAEFLPTRANLQKFLPLARAPIADEKKTFLEFLPAAVPHILLFRPEKIDETAIPFLARAAGFSAPKYWHAEILYQKKIGGCRPENNCCSLNFREFRQIFSNYKIDVFEISARGNFAAALDFFYQNFSQKNYDLKSENGEINCTDVIFHLAAAAGFSKKYLKNLLETDVEKILRPHPALRNFLAQQDLLPRDGTIIFPDALKKLGKYSGTIENKNLLPNFPKF